jgi:23S rRNA (uracil1939-C5)-methyltransferase
VLLSIEKLIYGGDGLARSRAASDERATTVFVPFVLPGEQVEGEIREEKPGLALASVTRVVESSPDRIEARCPYFQRCGGCHYQHIRHERQLEFKSQILQETLARVGKIKLANDIRVHASAPWNYRNRTRFKVRTAPEFALGYFRFGSHEFLPVKECPISSPLINRLIAGLTELKGINCPAEIEELELFADGPDEHMLGWAFCGRDAREPELLEWAKTVRREFPSLVGLHFFSSRRRSEDDDMPAQTKTFASSGVKTISYNTGHGEYQVSAGAFFQVNRNLIDDLISAVTANADGDVALDLYAGVGLFSLPLARSFHHIFAVEASQTSLVDLRQNVPAVVKAVGARTEDYLRSRAVRKRPELVVLDPPRTGVGRTVTKSLVELGPRQIRYVSCDPATLARDIASLVAAGYRIEEAHMFDLFPQTFHIESVMLLAR